MLVSRDGSTMEGRWFWGGYQEFGMDVQLVRQGAETIVLGTDRYSVPTPWSGEIHVYGGELPPPPQPPSFVLGRRDPATKNIRCPPPSTNLPIHELLPGAH